MRAVLGKLGSLKLAVVLLLVLAAAMAAASLYETRHGTEAALRDFYGAAWFAVILAAIGVNVTASLLLRWPFRWSRLGFVVAHVSILIILAGALVTRISSVHGRLWLRTDETRSDFDGEGWVLTMGRPDGDERIEIPVGPDGPMVDLAESGNVDGVTWSVEKFAADTIDEGERVVADPNGPQPAIKIRLGHGEHTHEQWLMGGQPGQAGGLQIRLVRVGNAQMLSQLLQPTSSPDQPKRGKLVAELNGKRYTFDLDGQIDQGMPLGDTGYRIEVGRYLPHAQVVGKEIRSATSRPVNPMVEFDLIDPNGHRGIHRLFGRFPDRDFAAPHATSSAPASQPVKFRYADATVVGHRQNAIDLLVGEGNRLHARFADSGGRVSSVALDINRTVETPWQDMKLTALEFLPAARNERSLTPVEPRKGTVMPAAFVCLRSGTSAHRLWLRKGESYDVHIDGKRVQVRYAPKRIPLSFSMKLIEPIITNYPGTDRPRTYKSRVLIEDRTNGAKREQTISMNAPLAYGGYSFYQSSYQFGRNNEPIATMLSVVSDPGEAVVYVGYVGLILGLIITLAQKVRPRAKATAQPPDGVGGSV